MTKKSLAAIQADVNNIKADVKKAYNIVDGKKNDYTREGAQKAAALARSVEHQIDYLERKGDNMHLEAGATASVDVSEIEGAEVEY